MNAKTRQMILKIFGEEQSCYRKLSSGQHLIFYIPHNGGIDVVRMMHGRMDVEVHLGE